jgi:hypothetical protein
MTARQATSAALAALSLLASGCGRGEKPEAPTAAKDSPSATESSDPAPASGPRTTGTMTSATGSFTARWSMPAPIPVADPFTVEIGLFADPACTVPLDDGQCRIDAAMPHHGHGMNVAPRMRREGPGRWKAAGMLLHMPGRWELFIDLDRDGFVERAQSTVVLP